MVNPVAATGPANPEEAERLTGEVAKQVTYRKQIEFYYKC